MIPNHIGYGLRNDEKPFAHKIPPGGNWRNLPIDEQKAFMKGSWGNGGGNSYQLRRMAWDEAAATITTAPMGKATCQLHPGYGEEYEKMVANHHGKYLKKVSPKTAEHNAKHKEKGNGFGLVHMEWDKPSGTIDGHSGHGSTANIFPKTQSGYEGEEIMFDITPQQPPNGLKVVELFAGGGLMGVGLKTAGFNLIWANDFVSAACKSYAANLGDHIVCGDITQIDPADIPDADVIAGGPPCQDYSVAGKGAGEDGERGKLVWTYLNIIEKKQPKAFIFENVKGLIQKKHRATFDALLVKFDEIGYNVSWQLINAWDYGVAQKRERVFIVGIRKDLGISCQFPQPRPEDYRTQAIFNAIGDLPEPSDQENGEYWYPNSEYGFDQANRVQQMDQPCATIPAHHNSGQPIHPTQEPRRFTVREALRLQSVPDWYVIPEDIKLGPAYTIVGNGVASRVAWYLGQALAEQLKAVEEVQEAQQQAAPTTAAHNTMQSNPILAAIIARIEAQTAKGIKKYGEAVKPSNLSLLEWIEHRQQEAVDQMVYMECIANQVYQVIECIKEAQDTLISAYMADIPALQKAINLLTGVLPHGEGQAKTPQDE